MEETPAGMDGENGKTNGFDLPKKSLKRKRESSAVECLSNEQKQAQIEALKREMEGLFGYYRELMGRAPDLISGFSECSSVNAMTAVLMEEKNSPLSKLVDEIYTKGKGKMETLSAAAVKSAVVSVGQRVMYGVPNADADVLEDETESCLWCWETRDLKMVPKFARGMLKIRRICRKKIHERIIAVSAMVAALQRTESERSCRNDLNKAAEKLGKILSEADIRSFMDNMMQKNNAEMAEKDAKREEKMLIKQMEKNRWETGKEKKKMERQMMKERLQCERELQEADNGEKHKEKEESELRKRKKNHQDYSEREQKRRLKEQAGLKKQVAVQKQASIMERFLKKNQTIVLTRNDLPSDKVTAPVSSSARDENANETVIHAMDYAFSAVCETSVEDLRRMHFASWHLFGHSLRSSSKQHWGMRKKPKSELFPELKLSSNKGRHTHDNENSMGKQEDALEEKNLGSISCASQCDPSSSCLRKSRRIMQLLQFDKSFRPAFYGVWPCQSQVIGPRHPLKKDPDLDYEIDSDEEWEEEEPGESLSDCENDQEECPEEGFSRGDDEDDSEDGFFVPDGYLSEDEGVQVDRMETDPPAQDDFSLASKQDQESQEFRAMLHRERHLSGLTEQALKKCQPLIICNLMHDKTPFLTAKEVDGPQKTEQICLQALATKPFPGSPLIEIMINNTEGEDQEVGNSPCSYSTPPSSSNAKPMLDLDLLAVVSIIQSCSQGINKVVEALQQKFSDVSKTQLRNKVREISDFEDNRWQVKKEILAKLGLTPSPDNKSVKRMKTISSFFSKRCLPPSSLKPNGLENENNNY
ncbi:PREDICTED: chromatin assembly factor 1 subunit FAS1-like [Tarenaya hassleriana]|uniref:chromatin assembly factor 1 subunit FAS1-like n=1 Tax=Tarenaya hassleriana TaxID=28532 RepID=UPI00053C156C|nr:PREDICTED: chromatin assembly factor 1 subunit FAS1-like [Tarenaya hassleriana]